MIDFPDPNPNIYPVPGKEKDWKPTVKRLIEESNRKCSFCGKRAVEWAEHVPGTFTYHCEEHKDSRA